MPEPTPVLVPPSALTVVSNADTEAHDTEARDTEARDTPPVSEVLEDLIMDSVVRASKEAGLTVKQRRVITKALRRALDEAAQILMEDLFQHGDELTHPEAS